MGARRREPARRGGGAAAARLVSIAVAQSARGDARLRARERRSSRARGARRRSSAGEHAQRPHGHRRSSGDRRTGTARATAGDAVRERESFFALAAELAARREPLATATVVSAERPTSAKPGAKAIVTSDGLLQGWIGGSCAAPVVKSEALSALADGEPRLVVISDARGAPRAGTRHYPMTCHSGGGLEIWVQPGLPPGQLLVTGPPPAVPP